MFSYRHGFHAGNHADVLKHTVMLALLRYMAQKDKAFWYIDTHAGAGAYSLTDGFAAKREEFHNGIGRLWPRYTAGDSTLPPLIRDYLDAVAGMNPDGTLQFYPGSPWLAWQAMRDQDRMRLFEWHPSEIEILKSTFAPAGKRAVLACANGFDAVRSVLPPPTRRALTLIDPSFEDKQDYNYTIGALEESLRRFPNGVYAVWYPIVSRAEALAFPARLQALGCASWLHVDLRISAPPADGYGLYGSGIFIINPPWVLADSLAQTMPWLSHTLATDSDAGFALNSQIP